MSLGILHFKLRYSNVYIDLVLVQPGFLDFVHESLQQLIGTCLDPGTVVVRRRRRRYIRSRTDTS